MALSKSKLQQLQNQMTADDAATAAYQTSSTAKPKTEAEQAALSSVTTATAATITAGTELPGAARTGVPSQPSATSTWNGSAWVEPNKTTTAAADPVYDALVARIKIYNIQGIADTLAQIRSDYPDITGDDMLTLLRSDSRYNKSYNERFSGNVARLAAGKAPLDEKTYFDNEQAYGKMFNSYELGQFANTKQYANLIANDISPTEATTRVSNVYNRVINADAATMSTFSRYYKMLTTADIVAGILDPKEQLPAIERKITSAEIGGAAVRQGLDAFQAATDTYESRKMYSNVTTGTIGSDIMARAGETGAQAAVDYQTIARDLPTMEKLSAISGNTQAQYGQVQAEQDVVLGLASAKRAKEELLKREAGRWSGSSGAAQGAFSTGYLAKESGAGQF